MSFDAHEEKIRKIFAGDAKFEIPRNQRKYVWKEKQWKELLGDILYIRRKQLVEQNEINHFLGTFVLQENENYYEIIDGQQRITTLLLILSAICAVFNEMESEEEHGQTRQYIVGNIGLKSQYCRMKNNSIPNIGVIIESVAEYRNNLISKSIIDTTLLERTGDGNKGVVSCFYYFYDYLKDNVDGIEELVAFRNIVLDMKVIHIASEDELDCYDIFEILNARGVDLEDGELLKNYIFKYAQPKYSIDRAKEIWNKIKKNMEECNGNMEQFLVHFVTYRFYKPTKDEGVFKIIKANTDKEKVDELLDALLDASEKYIWFYHPEQCKSKKLCESLEFFRLINHRQFRPLFMSIFEAYDKEKISENDINKIGTFLTNFSFGFTFVMGNNSNIIDSKIHSLSQNVYKNPTKESLEKIKTELMPYYPSYKEFKYSFLNIGFSNKNKKYKNSNNRKRMFYVLETIEECKQETNELVCNISECNIEHIMNDSETNEVTSKIGNLLLLSEHINNNMGNASFNEKKEKMKRSKLQTVQNFLKYYGSKEEWTEELIGERTEALISLAYNEVWKV